MPLIYNAPYRPDLNGIELLWRSAKSIYRNRVDRYKAKIQDWDQMTLVKNVIESICAKVHIKSANEGIR